MLSYVYLNYQVDIVIKGIPKDKFEKIFWDLLLVILLCNDELDLYQTIKQLDNKKYNSIALVNGRAWQNSHFIDSQLECLCHAKLI